MNQLYSLIDTLAADVRPVRPLKPPVFRAAGWLSIVALLGAVAVYSWSDMQQLLTRYDKRPQLMALEIAAMFATGLLAIVAAFLVSIPGRSRRWFLAPVAPFAVWLLVSGAGCYRDFVRSGSSGLKIGHSLDCLIFIVGVSLPLGATLFWLLSRARPVDPLPVALLGGLGIAAIAALILQFFHPFTVTFVDLAIHLVAIALVVGVMALLNRRTLLPA